MTSSFDAATMRIKSIVLDFRKLDINFNFRFSTIGEGEY